MKVLKVLTVTVVAGALGLFAPAGQVAHATGHDHQIGGQRPGQTTLGAIGSGLTMPSMDARRGRLLFATKGCVVCHSVNGVGGNDAPSLDASTMELPMSPFEFMAKMWRAAEAMIALQRQELGQPIELTGQELADIIAFLHQAEEQHKLSESDIPAQFKKTHASHGG